MIMTELNISQDKAEHLLNKYKSVRLAIQNYNNGK